MLHPLLTYGIEVRNNESSIFYTADTAYSNSLHLPQDIRVLLGEATFLTGEGSTAKATGHMSIKDLVSMAQRMKPELLIATHLWPGYTSEEIKKEIKINYNEEFIIARTGEEVLF